MLRSVEGRPPSFFAEIERATKNQGQLVPATLLAMVFLRRLRGCAYSRDVTHPGGARRRLSMILAAAVLASVVGTRSFTDKLDVDSAATHAAAIESVPGVILATSDRLILSSHAKLSEGQRGVWITTSIRPAINPAASMLGSVHSSPLMLSPGPVAAGHSGRGPPSFSES